MKRFLLPLLLLATVAYSQTTELFYAGTGNPTGEFTVRGVNPDVGTGFELVAGNSFVQMNAADSIQVVASAADTVGVTIFGIKSDSTRVSEHLRIPGSAAAVVTTNKYLFFESAKIDSYRVVPTGTFTFRTDDDSTAIAVIPIGQLETKVAQRFFGEPPTIGAPERGFLASIGLETGYPTELIQRIPMIDGAGTYKTGLDSILETESDTSVYAYDFTGETAVRLYTYANQVTTNDTVFVTALNLSPWGTVVSSVALDSLVADAGDESKDIASLVNTFGNVKFRINGANTSGADTTEVRLGVTGGSKRGGTNIRVEVRWYPHWDSARSVSASPSGYVVLGEVRKDRNTTGTTVRVYDPPRGYSGNLKKNTYYPNYGWLAAFGLSEGDRDSLAVDVSGVIAK